MIRYLHNRRLRAVWIYAAVIAIVNLILLAVASLTSAPIDWPALLLVEGAVVVVAALCFALHIDHFFPRRRYRRLPLYLVDTSATEIEARLEDLVQVGVFETHEQEAGGTLYTDTSYNEATFRYLREVALVHEGCVRWQHGAVIPLGFGRVKGFRYGAFGTFQLRPPRKKLTVDFESDHRHGPKVLGELERLGVVGLRSLGRDGRVGLFGTITNAEPTLPAYTWGSKVWWETLAGEGVLYLREDESITFAPRAAGGFVKAQRHFNELAESLIRLHEFAVQPPRKDAETDSEKPRESWS